MTAKQILDAFSETLMQDERILSPRERELLTSLLQNAKAVSSGSPETQSAVTAVIARSVGETVAQRAFSLLGSNIVEKIVAHGATSESIQDSIGVTIHNPPADDDPKKVPGGPQPPGIHSRRVQASPPDEEPDKVPGGPQPPGISSRRVQASPPDEEPDKVPGGPQPPGIRFRHSTSPVRQSSVAVLDVSAEVRTQCVVLDEFLAPQELDELIQYTLQHEADFRSGEIISPSGEPGVTDYSHRRSRVLMDMGPHEEVILDRIRGVLPRVLEQLGVDEFPVTRTEVQITASNDGDFFRTHSDDAQEKVASRRMTFVYFFHREPRHFDGGELHLHDSRRKGEQPFDTGYQTIVPQQNQIVFFPCSALHEITPVECPSHAFADSRFTLNGWLHK